MLNNDRTLNDLIVDLEPGLREIISSQLRRFERGDTLHTTEVFDQAYDRLSLQKRTTYESKEQFYAIYAHVIHRVVGDVIRRRKTRRDYADENSGVSLADNTPLLDAYIDINSALDRLLVIDQGIYSVAVCRVYGGLTYSQIALTLKYSVRTVRRYWTTGRREIQNFLLSDNN